MRESFKWACCPQVFPACTPEQPVEVHAFMDPAREVGGDLYDFFYASPHLFCFLVGDVSGKGAPSRHVHGAHARVLYEWPQSFCRKAGDAQMVPELIAEAVNRELYQNNDDRMFVTLFLGLLETRTGALGYINAGHPVPHILRATGEIEHVVASPDMPLGVRSKTAYRTGTLTLQPGDAIFVATDGVIEAMNAEGSLYTIDRLDADLRSAVNGSALEIGSDGDADHVRAFAGSAPKADDVTVLALRWRPA